MCLTLRAIFDCAKRLSCRFVIFFACPKKTEPKERAPYDLSALRIPCASRLHWREHKLASLKQVFALSNESCDARLHRRDEGQKLNSKTQFPCFDFDLKSLGVAPSTGVLCGKGPKGRGMDAARLSSGQGWPVERSPQRMRGAGYSGGMQHRVAFSLVHFFWPPRRNELAAFLQKKKTPLCQQG